MNWIQLYKDYPLAYDLMQDTFKCLYTLSSHVFKAVEGKPYEMSPISIKHPLKRDLYDFFDEQGVVIGVGYGDENFFTYEIDYNGGILDVDCKSMNRKETETGAFTKAFEILNDRL